VKKFLPSTNKGVDHRRFMVLGLLPLLILMFAAGFLIRLYRFDYPIADWHSFRQGDTNAVSAIYSRDGIDLLHPKYFDISNIQSGKDNPQGFRMVEFPVYNLAQVLLYKIGQVGGLTLVEAGRLVNILATLTGAYIVYLLTKKYADVPAGIFAAFFYLFLPFSIFYGRAILPDPSMTASILVGIYFFDRWLAETKKSQLSVVSGQLYLSLFFTALSFLIKPYALFFTLPMIWLAWEKFGKKIFITWQLYLFAGLTVAPLVAWRLWIGHFPEGIPVSDWLLNGNGIRFRPSFFKWIFYERITRLIMGYVGVLFLVLGSWSLFKNKNAGFFLSFAASSLIYLTVIASGNVQHDYYQILIIPTISIFAGLGASYVWRLLRKYPFAQYQAIVVAVLTVLIAWVGVKDYFNVNDWGMVTAAEETNKILPLDAKVIAPYDGSTAFLNIIQRQGWPAFEHGIEELTAMGADYLVLPNPSQPDIQGFGSKYETIASNSSLFIVKLR
jgi:hypothetical protein